LGADNLVWETGLVEEVLYGCVAAKPSCENSPQLEDAGACNNIM
jgi:hypothetical protein